MTFVNFLNMSDLNQFASQFKGKGEDRLELETSQVGATFLWQCNVIRFLHRNGLCEINICRKNKCNADCKVPISLNIINIIKYH